MYIIPQARDVVLYHKLENPPPPPTKYFFKETYFISIVKLAKKKYIQILDPKKLKGDADTPSTRKVAKNYKFIECFEMFVIRNQIFERENFVK